MGELRRTRHLTAVTGHMELATVTGEQVMREGAQLLADFLTRRLAELRTEDPWCDVIAADASRLRALAGSCNPRALPG